MNVPLARTPLHDMHVALGGRMAPFAGYSMPVHYPAGIRAEHEAVRTAAGIFDVSHMGEFVVRGSQAEELVQRLTANDVSRVAVGQAQYSALCNERGTVLDDLLVYRFADRFMLVVNGANRDKDWRWVQEHSAGYDAEVADESDRIALIALQGPSSQCILAPLVSIDLSTLGYYRFGEAEAFGADVVVSRTGYTGEDGFEIYLDAEAAASAWRTLSEADAPTPPLPAGLGARDSLRLEMGYALYGNDLDEDHNPFESGLGWIVKLDAGDFVGRDALLAARERGVASRLTGIRLLERGFPRPGYELVHGDEVVGQVTSGVYSPTLGAGIAMGYLPAPAAAPGTEVGVRIRNRVIPARTERPPFYSGGSIRR